MGFLSGKKLLLIGILLVLLVAIPVTVYLQQQQQQTQSSAAPSTTLSFANPASLSPVSGALQKNVGDIVNLDIVINPGSNLVSFVKLTITYDQTKLATSDAAITPNTTAFPTTLEGPIYTPGNISMTLSVGADPTKVIQSPTKLGTLSLKAIGNTSGATTQIAFSNSTQVLSIASSDQPSENVLSSTTPASVIISGSAGGTGGTGGTDPTPTPAETAGSSNQIPICTSLTTDATPSGTAPFSLNFTTQGNDPDGTISKVTFNFGDGPIQDVTQAGGIGTNSVAAQIAHTYNTEGTFTASAILTDNAGGISSACTQTVTVSGGIGGVPTETPTATTTPTTQPTLPPTGPGDTFLKIGVLGAVLSIIGTVVFLAL